MMKNEYYVKQITDFFSNFITERYALSLLLSLQVHGSSLSPTTVNLNKNRDIF